MSEKAAFIVMVLVVVRVDGWMDGWLLCKVGGWPRRFSDTSECLL